MRIFWKVTVNISVAKYEPNINQITIDSSLVIQELHNIGGKKNHGYRKEKFRAVMRIFPLWIAALYQLSQRFMAAAKDHKNALVYVV